MEIKISAMDVLDTTGHTRTSWNRLRPEEVESAREQFESLVAKGYKAFRVSDDGVQDEQMKTFDPLAERMLLIPPIVGG